MTKKTNAEAFAKLRHDGADAYAKLEYDRADERAMTSRATDEAVQLVLRALLPKIEHCPEQIDAQAVGNALYGINGRKDTEAVQLVLRPLAPKIEQCQERFSAQAVGMCWSKRRGQSRTLDVHDVEGGC
jgi:hypothetical protein